MEYIINNGTKVTVEGDNVKYGEFAMKKNIIGANFNNGVIYGGYISSFNGSFTNELIGIENGFSDIINAQLGDIKDAYILLKSKIVNIDNTDIYELSRIILETVDEYFGGIANINKRMSYYYSSDDEESKDNKISNLKGTGAAMCVERAALAQNLLNFLGINSFFKSSGIIKNNNKEVHSYNLIEFNEKYYIFDPSIPNLVNNQISPLIAQIDKDTYQLLSYPLQDKGISTTITHYNPYRDTDVTITYDSGREKHIEFNSLDKAEKKHL